MEDIEYQAREIIGANFSFNDHEEEEGDLSPNRNLTVTNQVLQQ